MSSVVLVRIGVGVRTRVESVVLYESRRGRLALLCSSSRRSNGDVDIVPQEARKLPTPLLGVVWPASTLRVSLMFRSFGQPRRLKTRCFVLLGRPC